MLIDPQLLRSFVHVADAGSVSRAADQVHLTQSAVSAQIKRLEAHLCCRVFVRTTRSLRLTPEGEALLGYARGILTLNHQAMLRLGAGRRMRDTVRVGCPEGLAGDWLFATLKRFRDKYPQVELEVTGGISSELFELTKRNALDITIGGRCAGAAEGELLWSEPLVWAFSARDFLDPLQPLPIAFLSEPCPYRDAALVALAEHRRPWRVAVTAQSSGTLLHAVQAGFAVTPLTPSSMPAYLRTIPPGDILPELPHVEFTMQVREGTVGDAATELIEDIREASHRWMRSK